MKAAFCNKEESHCATFIGMSNHAQEGGSKKTGHKSLLSSDLPNNGMDICSFYSGPSDETIMAFGESCGSIAFGEPCGSIAFSGGGESCGSVASSCGGFSGGSSSGGGGSFC